MRLVRCILALAVVAALGVALPGELAACSPMPGFPPEWARALNQLAAYRLAVAAAALALAAVLLAVWRGRMTPLAWVPVGLFVIHPAWRVSPSDNTCINTAESLALLSLFVSGGAVVGLAGEAFHERRRTRSAERAV